MANMNPKNELQEFLQKRQLPVPTYSSEPKGGHFCAKVKVRWKNGESLEDEGEGRKKKEAEMEAARSMLAKVRIREGLSPPTRSPPPSGLRGELLGLASPSSPSNSKGQLQEMLQKHGHPPPEYSVVRGSVNQMYTVKCVALTWGGQILAEGFGNARKKSDAEKNAAENVYPLVREVLNGGCPLSDFRPVSRHVSPPREVVDPDLDDGIMIMLTRFKPCIQYKEGLEEEGGASNWLCLVSTRAEGYSADSVLNVPVTGCGMGETKSQALRSASFNLIDNLNALGYHVQ